MAPLSLFRQKNRCMPSCDEPEIGSEIVGNGEQGVGRVGIEDAVRGNENDQDSFMSPPFPKDQGKDPYVPEHTNRTRSSRNAKGGDILDLVFERVESVACRNFEDDEKEKTFKQRRQIEENNSTEILSMVSSSSIIDDGQGFLNFEESAMEQGVSVPEPELLPNPPITREDSFEMIPWFDKQKTVEVKEESQIEDVQKGIVKGSGDRNRTARRDFLDYLFENVESFICRDKKKSPRVEGMELADAIAKFEAEAQTRQFHDANSVTDTHDTTGDEENFDVASDHESIIALHSLAERVKVTETTEASSTKRVSSKRKNFMRICCDMEPNLTVDGCANTPTIRNGQVDPRDANVRHGPSDDPITPNDDEESNYSGLSYSHQLQQQYLRQIESIRTKSVFDGQSESEVESNQTRHQRLSYLKDRKRRLEQLHLASLTNSFRLVKSQNPEPGVLVPRRYKNSSFRRTTESTLTVSEEQMAFRRQVFVSIVLVMVSIAVCLVAFSFFWPL